MQSQPSGVPFGNIRLCFDKTASPDFFMMTLKFDIIFFGYFSKRGGWTRLGLPTYLTSGENQTSVVRPSEIKRIS